MLNTSLSSCSVRGVGSAGGQRVRVAEQGAGMCDADADADAVPSRVKVAYW